MPNTINGSAAAAPVRLSEHFTLAELEHTIKPFRNVATAEERRHLAKLCDEILEPLRARFGPLRVTSGFRSAKVNEAVRGARNSAHRYGCAADVQAISSATPAEMVRWLRDEGRLPFDQAIDELDADGDAWLHVGILTPSMPYPAPRREALVQRHGKYAPFPR